MFFWDFDVEQQHYNDKIYQKDLDIRFVIDPEDHLTYHQSVAVLILVLTIISILGSMLVLLAYLSFQELRNFALKMVVYLCIADLFANISIFFKFPTSFQNQQLVQNDWQCQIQCYIRLTGDLSSILWCSLISYALFISVIKNERNLERFEKKFLLIGYLTPFIFALFPFVFDDFGLNTYFCWINDNIILNNYLYQLAFYYGPLWISVILIFVYNLKVFEQINERIDLSENQQHAYKRIMRFPFILVFCGFFSTIGYILFILGLPPNALWFQILNFTTNRSQGFLNACAYGIFPILKEKILICFGKNIQNGQINEQKNSIDSQLNDSKEKYIDYDFQDSLSSDGFNQEDQNAIKKQFL